MLKAILIKLYVNLINIFLEKGFINGVLFILFQNEGIFFKKTLANIKALFVKKEEIKGEEIKSIDLSLNQYHAILGSPKISIIIPTKDKSFLVKQCVDSILSFTTYKNYEIILLDNNSSEEETATLIASYKKAYPDLFFSHRIEAPFNFSFLMNQGALNSKGEYLVFLNNDTKVISPQWLEFLLEYAQLDFVGATGAKLLFENDNVQHAGIEIKKQTLPYHIYAGVSAQDPRITFNRSCLAITAACLMISRKKFEMVNGFNEALAVEFNDIDFCLKLIEKGLKNIYIHKAELYHYESISRGKSYKSIQAYRQFLIEERLYLTLWNKYWIQ
jgi:O-antigen biosynthesis protein